MTHRLTETSPHRVHAARFGAELSRAMERRGVGQDVVKEAAGVSRSSVVEFRHGRNLPTLAVAQRLAEALGAPRLEAIVREARTRRCSVCPRTFIQDTGRPRLYCSVACRVVGNAKGAPTGTADGLGLLKQELLRIGPIRRQVVGKAITLVEDAKAPDIAAHAALELHRDGVGAFCDGCEPSGSCRDAACPLRPVSPLPLAAGGDPLVTTASRPAGRWGDPGARERHAADMRWRHAANPAWAEATRERSRERWARMSAEEREAAARLIGEGRRRPA